MNAHSCFLDISFSHWSCCTACNQFADWFKGKKAEQTEKLARNQLIMIDMDYNDRDYIKAC